MDERLKELDQLDQESDFYALQCDFRRAAPLAKAYATLRRQLLNEGIVAPPSISVRRAGIVDLFTA